MKILRSLVVILALFLVGSVIVIYAQSDFTITEAVSNAAQAKNAEFTILSQLLDATDLGQTLDDPEAEYTVFAPTDDAFNALLKQNDLSVDDLLNQPDLLSSVLSYHVVEGTLLSKDLEDGMDLETLNGASITVAINKDNEITLNDGAKVVEADIELANGVIHVIDTVLVPPDSSQGTCTVSTAQARSARVRVGPGENRTSVAFLPENVDIDVLGQSTDDNGTTWYQVDKDTAAPGRSINEAWVSGDEVDTSGNCSDVADAAAPPIIPIISRPPVSQTSSTDSGSTQDNTDTSSEPAPAGTLPNGGSWTIYWNQTTNASCTGTGNIAIPTVELLGQSGMTISVSLSRSAGGNFTFYGTPMQSIGNGVYYGKISDYIQGQLVYGTMYIDSVVTANQMVGRAILSFDNCAATLTFVANHN